ncbi:ArsR/SmtB family transcription factor [Actinoplanes sp. HUAS TT8]|uniref:ArsR/SmtB family transcription factor n=1 Tax=Actinoplanes sp. HUAS TT8 TaxID=3447453 RepID=UPI003F51F00D
MISWEFGAADLAGLRFAHSPMAEVVASAFALRAGWVSPAWTGRVSGALGRWPTLRAVLFGPGGYAPDFLTPVPSVARPRLVDELSVIAATPLDRVVAEAPLLAGDPAAGLQTLITEIRGYSEVAIAPLWPRLRGFAEGEIAGRMRVAASQSPRVMIAGLHPRLGWDGSALLIKYPDKSGQWASGERMTFLPTGFAGPDVYAMTTGRSLWYAPRGYGELWSPAPKPSAVLTGLLGPTRAAVLTLVAVPASTGEVAGRLGLAPATASHHLTTLRDAGLVAASRAGRRVLYQRTHLGDQVSGDS